MKIHFCTFGSLNNYKQALERIEQQAKDSGFFDTVTCYTQRTTPGLGAHGEFIKTNMKGYGFWIWKPMIVLDQMKKAAPEDIIVYADTGCHINATPAAKAKFAEYIAMVQSTAPHRVDYNNGHSEEIWAKSDLLQTLGVLDTPHAKSGQYAGGYRFLLNTPDNKQLMEDWLELMTRDNYHLVDDTPSVIPNAEGFRFHRHDQAVISILLKLRGTITVPDAWPISEDDPISPVRSRAK